MFLGPNGLRAAWRLAIWLLLVVLITAVMRFVRHQFFPLPPRVPNAPLEPVREIISRALGLLVLILATLTMARLEHRKWGDYGLPVRRALSLDSLFGLVWGFGGLALVMGGLWLAGAYRIEGLALRGVEVWRFAGLWGVMFLVVGLLEEFTLRGYLLYTVASGIGFWPAAVVTSALFLAGHVGNPGETPLGLAYIFVDGLFLCFTLWRTGDLWFAVGAHAAWDWGLTYFFSVPNSGASAIGHLFNIAMQGPAWLGGGSAGPEGSILSVILDLGSFVVIAVIYKERKWLVLEQRRAATQPGVVTCGT